MTEQLTTTDLGTEQQQSHSRDWFLLYWLIYTVQLQSLVWLCNPTAACQAPLSSIISWSLWKFMSVECVMLSNHNHLILCCPLLLLPSIFPRIRVFSSETALHIRWPKYWSFSLASVFPMNIWSWFPLGLTGLISLLSKGLSESLAQPHN